MQTPAIKTPLPPLGCLMEPQLATQYKTPPKTIIIYVVMCEPNTHTATRNDPTRNFPGRRIRMRSHPRDNKSRTAKTPRHSRETPYQIEQLNADTNDFAQANYRADQRKPNIASRQHRNSKNMRKTINGILLCF